MSLMLSFVKREKGQFHRVKRSLYHSSSTARRCVRQGQHELSKLRLEVLKTPFRPSVIHQKAYSSYIFQRICLKLSESM